MLQVEMPFTTKGLDMTSVLHEYSDGFAVSLKTYFELRITTTKWPNNKC